MTVDLSKARAGMIAHLRCGGSAKIKFSEPAWCSPHNYTAITFEEFCFPILFANKNFSAVNVSNNGRPTIFDIIRLEDPPFDFKNIKHGMAFDTGRSHVTYYVAPALQFSDHSIVQSGGDIFQIFNG